MRNHVRHSRSERTQPSFAEGHERDLALAPFPGTDGLDDDDDRTATTPSTTSSRTSSG